MIRLYSCGHSKLEAPKIACSHRLMEHAVKGMISVHGMRMRLKNSSISFQREILSLQNDNMACSSLVMFHIAGILRHANRSLMAHHIYTQNISSVKLKSRLCFKRFVFKRMKPPQSSHTFQNRTMYMYRGTELREWGICRRKIVFLGKSWFTVHSEEKILEWPLHLKVQSEDSKMYVYTYTLTVSIFI